MESTRRRPGYGEHAPMAEGWRACAGGRGRRAHTARPAPAPSSHAGEGHYGSTQYKVEGLDIVGGCMTVHQISCGIEVRFQSSIPKPSKRQNSRASIPIPNSDLQCIHPNGGLENEADQTLAGPCGEDVPLRGARHPSTLHQISIADPRWRSSLRRGAREQHEPTTLRREAMSRGWRRETRAWAALG